MKPIVVDDDYTIINTQGIRTVEKRDGFGADNFRLIVSYKGAQLDYRYPDAAARDAQYARLRRAMESPPELREQEQREER